MIVFDYSVCPMLILAAILREVLEMTIGMHICVHNHHSLQCRRYFGAES